MGSIKPPESFNSCCGFFFRWETSQEPILKWQRAQCPALKDHCSYRFTHTNSNLDFSWPTSPKDFINLCSFFLLLADFRVGPLTVALDWPVLKAGIQCQQRFQKGDITQVICTPYMHTANRITQGCYEFCFLQDKNESIRKVSLWSLFQDTGCELSQEAHSGCTWYLYLHISQSQNQGRGLTPLAALCPCHSLSPSTQDM